MVRVTVSTKEGSFYKFGVLRYLEMYRLGTFWGYLGYIYLSDC